MNRGGGNDEHGGGGAKDYMREQLPFLALPNETKKKVRLTVDMEVLKKEVRERA